MKIKIKRVRPNDADIPIPRYMTPGSSGLDLYCCDDVTISPGEICVVKTGYMIEMPPGYEGQIRPRSGLAAKHYVGVVNSPGTIDCDYRGEIMVALIHYYDRSNVHGYPIFIPRGGRIAQLVIAPVERAELQLVDELSGTDRGSGGFGHTGT